MIPSHENIGQDVFHRPLTDGIAVGNDLYASGHLLLPTGEIGLRHLSHVA